MEFDITKIIYPIITAILGFFLRDIYTFFKKKLSKENSPKISLKYNYGYYSARSADPRIYKFKSKLIVHNIDTIPVYDVEIFKFTNESEMNSLYYSKELLSPTEKIEKEEEEIVKYGDGYNHIDEATKLLPAIFSDPKILIKYKNPEGKKFSLTWKKD
jgi:hypothetical protein